ncbi:MAG: bidirectional hydrogenase complex protein HoxE [Anaerolineales bacterium]|nr:bidirectional hydrogenase complex protein HoxE [Anaerolineales bacterium]MCA9975250.1 bidirectional hydrogenase complex protein HoxE [Anaerolineales bacterium]
MFPHEKIEPPSDDKRWRIVQATMRRNGFARHALIETLHSVQESFGFLDEESLRYVARSLRVPLSSVYGVSTFYHLFSLKPAGKHTCVLCTGTACYIKGTPQLLDKMAETYDIAPGETTADGELSLMTARCVGSCGLAPVAVLDGEVVGKLTPESLQAKLQQWRKSDDVA